MDAPNGGPLLFLSHAGADTEAALDLAHRLERAPAARKAGLRVWIDQRDLARGRGWQRQLEDIIEHRSTAFAVYMRGRGANWVEAEVRLALSRATGDAGYPFVPILVGAARPADLPPFARQYHAVKASGAEDPTLLRDLLEAVLRPEGKGPVAVVEHPFVGLASFDQEAAELFHGRGKETKELVEHLRRTNLVMVVGDSGLGKSSLVRAGLVPRFRGGAFADRSGDRPDPTFWQVVEMRPQGQPFERLVDAIDRAAERAGVGLTDRGTLADWVRTRDPAKIRDAIRASAPAPSKALLLVDQFEELWTLPVEAERAAFVRVLLGVAENAGADCRVVLTMRRDYYNLLPAAECRPLYERLGADGHGAFYLLGRMSDEGLRRIVTEPLRLAGVGQGEREALADAVLRDVGVRPGDLALVQFALTRAWERRAEFGGDLLRAYHGVGGVEGALAGEAERVFEDVLGGEANGAEVAATLIRLARLERTAGPTRRVARRREFPDGHWAHLQKLASKEGNRLVLICDPQPVDAAGQSHGKETAEIAHEALLTRWPRLYDWLNEAPEDKRTLDRLADRAVRWADAATPEAKKGLLVGSDAEREAFAALERAHPLWLSTEERDFVKDSNKAHVKWLERERRLQRLALISAALVPIVLVLAVTAFSAHKEARAQRDRILRAQADDLASAADREAGRGDAVTALLLALQPLVEAQRTDSPRGVTAEAERAAYSALLQRREEAVRWHKGAAYSVAFSPDGRH